VEVVEEGLVQLASITAATSQQLQHRNQLMGHSHEVGMQSCQVAAAAQVPHQPLAV
jgi:hypothetical protein